MPLWRPGVEVIVASTGHAVLTIAPDIPDCRLVSLRADGFGDARDPRLIAAFAGPGGWIDCQKILMAGRGSGHPGVPPRLENGVEIERLSAGGGGRSYPHAGEKGESGGACAT